MSAATHALRNALSPLTLHDDAEVAECARWAADALHAIELDLAAVEGLRARVADLERRIAATEAALDEERARTWSTDDESDEDETPAADSAPADGSAP